MDPFTQISKQNPNEIHGVRACLGAGQRKGRDCGGEWTTFVGVQVADHTAPYAVICAACLRARVAALDAAHEAADLGYAAPPAAPARPKTVKRVIGRKVVEEELSL